MWLRQRDGVTCGPSVAVMAGALLDAEYGAPLRADGAVQWFHGEQGRVHRAVNTLWPRALGTTPAGMARALSAHGVAYRWRPACGALPRVCAALGNGHPVAMLIGSVIPRHWVLLTELAGSVGGESRTRGTTPLTELAGSAVRCYDPALGRLVEVPLADIARSRLRGLGFPRPFVFVLPVG